MAYDFKEKTAAEAAEEFLRLMDEGLSDQDFLDALSALEKIPGAIDLVQADRPARQIRWEILDGV